ncbi:RelA/SpoT family protein [Streptomyces odontomachi]|uniref:RelA/SpoT family protein n=1 Tax=Streptomyces odontomachi TaxID=2944940 RepID=UPI002109B39D|nr:HD domain-containing protein [Streptomyces sp. ODS25]
MSAEATCPPDPPSPDASRRRGLARIDLRRLGRAALLGGADRDRHPDAITHVVEAHRAHFPRADREPLRRAYVLAESSHRGQFRKSGEPYITHPLAVTLILAELGAETTTLTASLLHDTVEDTDVTLDQVGEQFGAEVRYLVDGVTKLAKVDYGAAAEPETFRKMLVATGNDVRVMSIKLADRLHNMRTLGVMRPEKQERIARVTQDVLIPLAERLGVQAVKAELEDLVFAILQPDAYLETRALIAAHATSGDDPLPDIAQDVRDVLREAGISADVHIRPRHSVSVHRIHRRRGELRGADFGRLLVLVAEDADCYAVLGELHTCFTPVIAEFKDFIAVPKFNLYQSLHTAVARPDGQVAQVLIRTHRMHKTAEAGVIALGNPYAPAPAAAHPAVHASAQSGARALNPAALPVVLGPPVPDAERPAEPPQPRAAEQAVRSLPLPAAPTDGGPGRATGPAGAGAGAGGASASGAVLGEQGPGGPTDSTGSPGTGAGAGAGASSSSGSSGSSRSFGSSRASVREAGDGEEGDPTRPGWLSRLLAWQEAAPDPDTFWSTLREDLAQDREITVFRPGGGTLGLPAGASCVDAAYAQHGQDAHACIGARVNGRLVSLGTVLSDGDTVQLLLAQDPSSGPSRKWLDHAHTPAARIAIERWLATNPEDAPGTDGTRSGVRSGARSGLPDADQAGGQVDGQGGDETGRRHGGPSDARAGGAGEEDGPLSGDASAGDDAAVRTDSPGGKGDSSGGGDGGRGSGRAGKGASRTPGGTPSARRPAANAVVDLPGATVRLAGCCTPVPPDRVTAFAVRGGAVTVHRAECTVVPRMQGAGRAEVGVHWGESAACRVTLFAESFGRPHLLADLTEAIAVEGVAILSAKVDPPSRQRVRHTYTLELPDAACLPALMRAMRAVPGVYDVSRAQLRTAAGW